MSTRRLCLAAALTLAAAGASAQGRDTKFKLLVDGVYGMKIDYAESRSFQEFAETGSLDVDYSNDAGPGFMGALQFDFVPRFGIRVGFSAVKKDGAATYEGSFPHPLYFNRARSVSGEIAGTEYKETAVHLDAVFTAPAGRLDFSLFAGASRTKVEADLAGNVNKNEVYPFDEVSVSLVGFGASDTPIGFNGGAGLDFRFSDHLAFGAQFFYSSAKAKLVSPAGGTIEIDAGGSHATAGLRILF